MPVAPQSSSIVLFIDYYSFTWCSHRPNSLSFFSLFHFLPIFSSSFCRRLFLCLSSSSHLLLQQPLCMCHGFNFVFLLCLLPLLVLLMFLPLLLKLNSSRKCSENPSQISVFSSSWHFCFPFFPHTKEKLEKGPETPLSLCFLIIQKLSDVLHVQLLFFCF